FAKESGATVIQDGAVDYGKLRAMLESGKRTWDVGDVTIDFLYSGVADNLLCQFFYQVIAYNLFEKIHTSAHDMKRVNPKYVHEMGVGDIVWSYNLGYSKTAYKDGKYPQNWADLVDLQKLAGQRML